MLDGFIGKIDGVWVIKVDGFPRMRFFFYSKREALARYREAYDLQHKRITWTKCTPY